MKRKVIAVGPLPPPTSGGSIAFKDVCEDLERLGSLHEVIDISPPAAARTGIMVSVGRARLWLAALYRLDRALARSPGCLVYLSLGQSRAAFLRDLWCVLTAGRHDAVLIGHVHGGSYDLLYEESNAAIRESIRWMLSRMQSIVVLGEGLRRMFDFAPELKHRVVVVPNGLPADAYIATAAREIPTKGPLRLLFLSNLVESKGYLELLRAAAILRRLGMEVQVDLAGEIRQSPDDVRVRSVAQARELLGETIRSLGLDDVTVWHGMVDGAKKRALLESSHILVLPTRYRFEGQPIAIIEALGAGLPVIATRFRAITDLVSDRESGVLLDDASPESVADAVSWLASPANYSRASQAAIEHVKRGFTTEHYLARMRALFNLER